MDNWKSVLLNRSGRPILVDEEHNLYVREDIGLYHGRLKVVDRQNGRVYITNKRLIYVDNQSLKHSLAILIGDIDSLVATEGFLRSSPKVKVIFKKRRPETAAGMDSNGSTSWDRASSTGAGAIGASGTEKSKKRTDLEPWICMICSFSNLASSVVCLSCGIKKIALARSESPQAPLLVLLAVSESGSQLQSQLQSRGSDEVVDNGGNANSCPFCTFINHPSLTVCEMCGSELRSRSLGAFPGLLDAGDSTSSVSLPANVKLKLEDAKDLEALYVKFSFRKGGEKKFFDILQEQLDGLRWEELVSKGNINVNGTKVEATAPTGADGSTGAVSGASVAGSKSVRIGIHGLEQLGEQQRKLNEFVLSTSLEDLEQLMYKAQDLLALLSSFSHLVKPIAVAQNLIPPLNIKKSSKLYHRELSRHVSEYLHTITLTRMSSMITVQDLFAQYNRYLSSTQGFGTELVGGGDLNKAIELFDELGLPFKRRKYEKSGLVVITPNLTNDYSKLIKEFIENEEAELEKHRLQPAKSQIEAEAFAEAVAENKELANILGDTMVEAYFKGKSVAEIAENFHWSYPIAEEEIETCIINGTLVVDEDIAGTFYFINKFAKLC